MMVGVTNRQNIDTRARATSLAYGSNWVCNFFVALISPILLDASSSAAYFLFGGSTALATVVCYYYMVETKGKFFDEIERAFRKQKTTSSKAERV
ncbi:hypothetical protein F5B22DRAFT_620134, partial [Xylaria bambusicola]|uniref:uncharacterized protein n=1 Tax=Xylaria bambusicola TaxID=326684 RepID=UPI002007566D